LKFALHRDYPITGDDGGYGFSRISDEKEFKKVTFNMDWLFRTEVLEIQYDNLKAALLEAAKKDNLVVLIGGGSGNNTMAEIVAVLDTKNNEIVYLMNSNFGSDD